MKIFHKFFIAIILFNIIPYIFFGLYILKFQQSYQEDIALIQLRHPPSASQNKKSVFFDFHLDTGSVVSDNRENRFYGWNVYKTFDREHFFEKESLKINLERALYIGKCYPKNSEIGHCHFINRELIVDKVTSFTKTFFILVIIFLVFIVMGLLVFSRYLVSPIEKLVDALKNIDVDKGGFHLNIKSSSDDEIAVLISAFQNYLLRIKEGQKAKIEKEKTDSVANIAMQVAHDIRSPLAALNMIVRSELSGIHEENRVMIRNQIDRIHDIANNLITKNIVNKNPLKDEKLSSTPKLQLELLSSAIEEIITEKRIFYRTHLDLNIIGDLYDNNNYGLFAAIHLMEFKRILSNLLNNAVEAIPNAQGKITVSIYPLRDGSKKMVGIVVADNGKGIPPDLIAQLGQRGVSFGKQDENCSSGHGLGLYHAKTTIEKWGGTFSIVSEVDKGTSVTMTLPYFDAPSWFVPQITLIPASAIVILDDDQGIHFTWDNRFKDLMLSHFAIDVFHLSNPCDFENWIESKAVTYKETLFLSDHELIGFKETGLDLLEKYKLSNAILVTSHYENKEIRERCSHLGVRLIPKMLAGFVPIKVASFATPL